MKNKERQLLLPKSLVETWLDDLEKDEKVEIFEVIFNWYLERPEQKIKNRTVRLVWNNVFPFLNASKENYNNGKKGGAPLGNNNAKKTTQKTTETTPLDLENNRETTPFEKVNKLKDKDKDKDKDNIKYNTKDTSKDNSMDNSMDIFADLDFTDKQAQDLITNELLNKLKTI